MFFEHFSTKCLSVNYVKNVLQKSSVTGSHIQNPFGLFFNRTVKNLDNYFVQNFEVSCVCSTTSPNIHFSIYVNFVFTKSNITKHRSFSEHQFFDFAESRQVRNRNSISGSSSCKEKSGFGELIISFFFCKPIQMRQKIQYPLKTFRF